MEGNKAVVPVTLKGGNYLLWSLLVKTAVGSKVLWGHITESGAPKLITYEGDKEVVQCDEEKWEQDDQLVMSILQQSLEVSILEAYSYCETAKDLWDTLKKVYGNISNLSRVFEVKRAINSLTQEDMEFTKHLGRFRALWSELEMLRPGTTNLEELAERREQDKVFGLLLTLNPSYNSLIKHILRSGMLPDLEEVCAQVQKEESSIGLFGGKGEITLANQAEVPQANRARSSQYDGKKFTGNCDHCKRQGHKKNNCWILHPHLKPAKFSREKDGRANVSYAGSEPGSSSVAGSSGQAGESSVRELGDSKALMTYTAQPSHQNIHEHEYLRRSDLGSLTKMLKENGNTLGTLGYSFGASYEPCSIAREPDQSSIAYKPTSTLGQSHIAHNLFKPLIVDSGASHHMISDSSLIRDIEPTNGHVMIANGDKIPIRGIGKLKLFDKESKAFYMPDFTSNLLSDIESSQLIGKGVTKGDLYLLEELAPVSDYLCSFTSESMMNKNALWHARLGHPHVRALNLMLPDNGGEYTGQAFKQHLAQDGILYQTSCPYTPQQNGVAARKNRHLMEVARSMMFQANVPKRFWSDAVATSCYLINRIPTKILHDQSPFEVVNKYKPSLEHMRIFGCLCFVLRPKELRNKLEATSTRAMFVGYSTTQKGYKCYDPTTRRVLVSRDVKFIEAKGIYEEKNQEELLELTRESDRAASLRSILEGLGIHTAQDPKERRYTTNTQPTEASNLDHGGGNQYLNRLKYMLKLKVKKAQGIMIKV
ncbi:PREDICTED: uncharacterized protein LOC106321044 [Brassica oleracea var. oleracea]|uniref:uncharacterized protein LOC106321044 n=1 Tax=Brassica oleracea var. oleracea TaxID=109376 RepID=UPI0006A74443|nr:PREDICTED: uncharacterized protein LOC106321044 [Brassica oleracea var. oleracea]